MRIVFGFYTTLFFVLTINSCCSKVSKPSFLSIVDDNGSVIYYENNNHNSDWINIDEIPSILSEMVVCIEDKRFYSHYGFDSISFVRVLTSNIVNNELKGASTITQQLSRNLYLNNEKSLKRKIKELGYSINIEKNYSKKSILEAYLNTCYLGEGIYGIKDASYYYFGKSVSNLNISDISILIGLINNPTLYSPIKNHNNCIKKRDIILRECLSENIITYEEYKFYSEYEINITESNIHNNGYYLYYKDMVIKELKELGLYEKYEYLNIHTGFNSSLNTYLENYDFGELETSVIICDSNGVCSSLIGGNKYSEYNRSSMSYRMIGSTIKPFLYYSALERGFNPTYTIDCSKKVFYYNDVSYSPSNNNDLYVNEPITMLYALATSDNMYAVNMHLKLGINVLSETLNTVGLKNSKKNLSLSLGSYEATLHNLTNSYLKFVNPDYGNNISFITKITDFNNKVIYEKRYTDKKNNLDKGSIYVLNDMLTYTFDQSINNTTKVTCSSISNSVNYRYCGKTGTTDFDSYMIGYNPDYIVTVWKGYDDNSTINDKSLKTKIIWKDIMEFLMNDKYDNIKDSNVWFNKPDNVYMKYVDATNLGNKKWVSFKNPLPYYYD